jgi:hypothetical protein
MAIYREDQVVDRQVTEERAVARAPWSPAQLVALVIGLAFVVMGGVALARTGLTFTPIHYAQVAGFGHTALLAIIEIVFGVVVLAAGAMPGADRGGMIFAGVVALAGGLIIAIQPSSFHRVLGVDGSSGWLFVIAGVILLFAAMVSPVFATARSGAVYDRRDRPIA